MISPQKFTDNWNKEVFPLIKYTANRVNSLLISEEAKEFMIIAGLPESAAPFLNFETEEKGGIKKVTEKYNLNEKYSKYIYLGFTETGNPLCLVEESGEVVYLDHENKYNEIFINSSIPLLAESLLEYSEFIKKIKQINGRRAFLDRNAPNDIIEWFKQRLYEIDPIALNDTCFWKEELDNYIK